MSLSPGWKAVSSLHVAEAEWLGGRGTEKEQTLRTQRTRGSSPDHWASVTGYGEGGTLRISVKGVLLRFEKKII